MDFGNDGDDCPFDSFGDGAATGHPFGTSAPPTLPHHSSAPPVISIARGGSAGHTAAPPAQEEQQGASVQLGQNATEPAPPVNSSNPADQFIVVDKVAPPPPTVENANPTTIMPNNPFGESESADFTLSADESLEATRVDAVPPVVEPSQRIESAPLCPAPAKTLALAAPQSPLVSSALSSTSSAPLSQHASIPRQKTTPKVLEHNPFETEGAEDLFADADVFRPAASAPLIPPMGQEQQASNGCPTTGVHTTFAPAISSAPLTTSSRHDDVPLHPPGPPQWAPSLPPMPQFPSTAAQGVTAHHALPLQPNAAARATSPLLPPLPTLPTFTVGGNYGGSHLGSAPAHHAVRSSQHAQLPPTPHQRSDSYGSSTSAAHPSSGFNASMSSSADVPGHASVPHQPHPQHQQSPHLTPHYGAPYPPANIAPASTSQQQPSAEPHQHHHHPHLSYQQHSQQQRVHGHDRYRSEGSAPLSDDPPPYPVVHPHFAGGPAGQQRSDSAPVPGHQASAHQFHRAQPNPTMSEMMPRRAESQQFFEQQAPYAAPQQTTQARPQPHVDYQQDRSAAPHSATAPHHVDPQSYHERPHFFPRHHQQQQQQQQQPPYQPAPPQPAPAQYCPPPHFAAPSDGFSSHQHQVPQEYISPTESHLLSRRRGFVGCIAIGGRLIYAASSAANAGKALIKLRSLTQVLADPAASTESGRQYASSMSGLPGCITPATKSDIVLKTLQHIPNVSPILLSILQAMCTKSMEWAKGGQQELIRVFQQSLAALNKKDPSTSSSPYNTAAQPAWGHQEALGTIQTLLMAGERQEAVRCAMHYKLHSHALLIAMMCDTKDVYQGVVQSIIQEQLDPRAPLAMAYCAFNELPPPEVTSEDDRASMLSHWAEHVSMMLSNFTREAGETLLQLGDQLVENGQYDCAHVCYLVAQLSPASRPGPQAPPKLAQVAEALRSRYLLLGGHYQRSKCRAALLQPHTVFLTEALEYSRQRENEKFVRSQLIPFRVMMAELYAELGMKQHLESYVQHLSKLLPSCQPRKDDYATRTVAEVVDALRKRTAAMNASQGGGSSQKGGGWWPTSLFGGGAPSSERQGSAAPKSALAPSSVSRASSANPVPSSRPGAVSPPPSTPAQQPTHPQQQQQPPTQTKADAEPEARKPKAADGAPKKSWGIGSLFRRSGSRPQTAAEAKQEEEAKAMIIDTEAPPTYDPVSGRWLFAKSKEEIAVEQQIMAGPPKMPTPTGGSPLLPQGPQGAAPPGGPPPPPGQPAASALGQRKYVDMFNS